MERKRWGVVPLGGLRQVEGLRVQFDGGPGLALSSTGHATALERYAEPTALCPEIFVTLDLAPGQKADWRDRYSWLAG